jgi:hypothetical protein
MMQANKHFPSLVSGAFFSTNRPKSASLASSVALHSCEIPISICLCCAMSKQLTWATKNIAKKKLKIFIFMPSCYPIQMKNSTVDFFTSQCSFKEFLSQLRDIKQQNVTDHQTATVNYRSRSFLAFRVPFRSSGLKLSDKKFLMLFHFLFPSKNDICR